MDTWDFKGLPPEHVAVLSLGGNLGDVESAFRGAIDGLAHAGFEPLRMSALYKTAPVGCEPGAPDFLNAVAIGRWPCSPVALLKVCKALEEDAGRPGQHPRWQSRPLDIDIVAFGPAAFSEEGLAVPHPLATTRLFVLEPLVEIAPGMLLPGVPCDMQEALKLLLTGGKNLK